MKIDISELKKLKQTIDKIKPDILQKVLGTDHLNRIAKAMSNQVKKRTQVGKSVASTAGTQQNFQPLKPRTIEQRKRASKVGQLSPNTRPSKSNLTETGKMLDSLEGRSLNRGEIEIYISDTERAEVAKYHHEGGGKLPKRPFMFLAKFELKMISDAVNEFIKFLVDKSLK